jgi:hypothetical protein
MFPESAGNDHREGHGDDQVGDSGAQSKPAGASAAVDQSDPFYERLSLRPALKAIVARAARRIKPRRPATFAIHISSLPCIESHLCPMNHTTPTQAPCQFSAPGNERPA